MSAAAPPLSSLIAQAKSLSIPLPNILVTGTPGVGKTVFSQRLSSETEGAIEHVAVSDWVKQKQLYTEYDDVLDSYVQDDDKICDELEPLMKRGGVIVDFHDCAYFPERWFDLVLVLRSDNDVHYDRLKQRGYNEHKLAENHEAEIMQVILDEAREAYPEHLNVGALRDLPNNNLDQLQQNVDATLLWLTTRIHFLIQQHDSQ